MKINNIKKDQIRSHFNSSFPDKIDKGDRFFWALRRDEPKDRFCTYCIYEVQTNDILGFRILVRKGGSFEATTWKVADIGHSGAYEAAERAAWGMVFPGKPYEKGL